METIESLCQVSGLPPLKIGKKITLPIVQGGMGVGVSDGRLAGSVAHEGAVGTLSSVGLAWTQKYKYTILHALIKKEKSVRKLSKEDFNQLFYDATLEAARREIRIAQELSGGRGALWLNTMVAINDYKRHVELACSEGLDGVVSGAGLPLDLPNITKDFPDVSLIPILSNLRGVKPVMKKWERLGRLPDAIILEDPTRAGGHLGASSIASFDSEDMKNSTLEIAVPEVRNFLESQGLGGIPIIAAGGIVTHEDIKKVIEMGASGVQLGTRFLASHESGANTQFKQSVLEVKDLDDIRLYTSNAMLPARAIRTSGVFQRIVAKEAKVTPCVENCLRECAYRDGVGTLKNTDTPAQMCILDELVTSVNPDGGANGLMFVGTSALRIQTLLSVHEIIEELLGLSK